MVIPCTKRAQRRKEPVSLVWETGSDLLLCEPPRGIEPLTYSLRKAVLGSSDGQRQFRMRW